ncbi:MAG TPA: flagellar biosynthetic protein FliR [Burkholderiaceae bacterium]|nr:flagellar biosynthetic protein FliR [Burkholderiaceae bacterium]
MITFTSTQLSAWYGAVFWPLVRVLALFTAAPLLSHRAIPLRVKVALGVAITVVLVPNVPTPTLSEVLSAAGLALLIQNILVGTVIGFTVRIVFAAFELAGELIGLQMGLSFAGFFNPGSGSTENAVASFMSLLALLCFLAIDGHLMLVHALAESFRIFPLTDAAQVPLDFNRLVHLATEMFAIALSLALPFIAVLLLINIVLGVLARVAPQLNVFAVGFPLTLLAGMMLLFTLLPYIEGPLRAALERAVVLWRL